MKCYFAGSMDPYNYPYVEACFANSHKEAKHFMWKHSHTLPDECDGDYMNLKVIYQKEYGFLAFQSEKEPYLIKDKNTLRAIGWSLEGEQMCDCCGLFAMGMDEFYVCATCGQCKECGFDSECEDH